VNDALVGTPWFQFSLRQLNGQLLLAVDNFTAIGIYRDKKCQLQMTGATAQLTNLGCVLLADVLLSGTLTCG
jgi:hypothetical protein